MPRLFAIVVCCLALSVSGCADTHVSIMKETVGAMNDVVTALESVSDEATAKAAAPRVEAFAARFQNLKERQRQLDAKAKPTAEERKALEEIRDKDYAQVKERLDAAMQRLQNVQGALTPLQAAFRKVRDTAFDSVKISSSPTSSTGAAASPGGMPPGIQPAGGAAPAGASPQGTSSGPPPGFRTPGFRPPAAPDQSAAAAKMIAQYGRENVVTVVVNNSPAGKFSEIVDKVKALGDTKSSSASGRGTTTTIVIAPIGGDLQALSSAIDFGVVTDVDAAQRRITVTADPSKF